MLEVVRPRYVLPTHGEERHLRLYAAMAYESGYSKDDVLIGQNGTVFGFDHEGFTGTYSAPTGTVYLGPGAVGEIEDGTVSERRLLARDGVLSVVLTLDRRSGKLLSAPEISARGFVPGTANGQVLEAARRHLDLVAVFSERDGGSNLSQRVEQSVRESPQSFVFAQTKRRPLVLPTVIEV